MGCFLSNLEIVWKHCTYAVRVLYKTNVVLIWKNRDKSETLQWGREN